MINWRFLDKAILRELALVVVFVKAIAMSSQGATVIA
jgi:hypothetical protein